MPCTIPLPMLSSRQACAAGPPVPFSSDEQSAWAAQQARQGSQQLLIRCTVHEEGRQLMQVYSTHLGASRAAATASWMSLAAAPPTAVSQPALAAPLVNACSAQRSTSSAAHAYALLSPAKDTPKHATPSALAMTNTAAALRWRVAAANLPRRWTEQGHQG